MQVITEKELLDVYEKIPHVKCVPGCSACCGPVVVGKTELVRIKKWLKARGMKLKPLHKDLTCGYVQMTFLSSNRKTSTKKGIQNGTAFSARSQDMSERGRCMIYNVRPLLCRLFGAVRGEPRLKCRFLELPENALSSEQANEMMVEVYKK
jgi:Fe-S-cluster containining protein